MNAVAPISTPHAKAPLKQQYEIYFLSINSEGQNKQRRGKSNSLGLY